MDCFSCIEFYIFYAAVDVSSMDDSKSGRVNCSYWTRRRRTKKLMESWKSVASVRNTALVESSRCPCDYPNDITDDTMQASVSQVETNEMSDIGSFTNYFSGGSYQSIGECNVSDCDLLNNFQDGFSSDCGSNNSDDDITLAQEIADWTVQFGITSNAVDKLLKILQSYHPQLPLTCCTLLESGRCIDDLVVMSSGEYMHYGLRKGLLSQKSHLMNSTQRNIQYQVNVDGLPLFKSSSTQLWPILGKVVGIKADPFLIGAYCGSCKPQNIDEFLKAFIIEANSVAQEGVEIDDFKFVATISSFICDAPARAFLKQIKGHTAYFGCERCVQKGSHIDSKMTFPSSEAVKRKDDEFSVMVYTEHQLKLSPLQELHIGLVSSFVLDSMHLVYLGVTRRLMSRWIKGPRATKLSHLQLDIISSKLVQLARYIPSEFARKPRSLHELDR